MSELSDKIKDLGEKVLELENGFRLIELIKSKEVGVKGVYENFNKLTKLFFDFDDLKTKNCGTSTSRNFFYSLFSKKLTSKLQ